MKTELIFACALLLFSSIALSSEKHEYSGFLGDYPKFQRNKQTGAEVWFHSEEKDVHVLRPYRKILLSPIEIWLGDESYKGIQPDTLKAMADYFTFAIHRELDHWYEFVNEPGPGVLHLRIAITNVKFIKPNRKWYGYIPVALAVEGGKKVARASVGLTVDLIEASVELEGLDSLTEERIVAAIDTHQTKKIEHDKNEPVSWGHIKEIFDYWAKRIRTRMDEARDVLIGY